VTEVGTPDARSAVAGGAVLPRRPMLVTSTPPTISPIVTALRRRGVSHGAWARSQVRTPLTPEATASAHIMHTAVRG